MKLYISVLVSEIRYLTFLLPLSCVFMIVETRELLSDTSQVLRVSAAIKQFREENGHPITEDDFLAIVRENKVPSRELRQYVGLLKELQKPSVTLGQLIALYRARQSSINSIKVKWRHVFENKKHATTGDFIYSFVLSGRNALLETIPNETNRTEPNLKRIASYDGEIVRLVDVPLSELSQDRVNAFISRFESYESYFITPDNILWLAMLVDSDQYSATENFSSSVLDILNDKNVIVYEHPQDIQGVSCCVISNGVYRVYLAPEYQYSVIGFEIYTTDTYREGGERYFNGVKIRQRRVLSNFSDYGNGLFLPKKIVTEIFSRDDGVLEVYETVDIQSIEINEKYDKEHFSNIIPDDAMVADGINNIVYRQSDRPSIDALLKETAKSKRVWIFKYISMALGLAMIIFALVAKYLAYRKRKNNP